MATRKSLASRDRSRSRSRSRSRGKSPGRVQFIATRKVPKKKNKPAGVKNTKHNRQMEIQLSPCARDYAHALLNPCGAPPPCMPSVGGCHSRKLKIWTRTTMATSSVVGASNALGFATLAPGPGVANNNNWLLTTDATSTLTVMPTVAGSGVIGAASNSEYASANFGAANASFRLVSACLRIRYAGTELNRGGAVFSILEPDHNSLAGKSISLLRAYPNCVETPVTADWTEVVYLGPVQPGEFEYINDPSPGVLVGYNLPIMGFAIKSAVAGVSFDVEAWGNYEVIGPNVTGKTQSFSDPQGLSLVTAGAMEAGGNGQSGHHGHKSFLTKAIEGIGHAAKAAFTFLGPSVSVGVKALAADLLPKVAGAAVRAAPMLM